MNGILLTLVEMVLDLYEKTKGIADDIVDVGAAGLAISAAADIMAAIDDRTSVNALISDLIVDLLLFGVGKGAEWGGAALGASIATAVATPAAATVGGVIGKAVGGVVGTGISMAMELIDFNGDEEGGTGKDAVSDWLEGIFDKLWGDYDF